jgi:DNA polymerase-1
MAKKKKRTHALIDADIVVYQACAAVEREIQWEGDWWTLHADGREAKELVDLAVAEIKEDVNADKISLCFSSPNNWRMTILPEYKANRAANRKPICYRDVLDYCYSTYPVSTMPRLEADDVIGILATRKRANEDIIVVSEDKDFKSVPGMLFNPKTKVFTLIDPEVADRFHLYQTLIGDSADNYKGCPGVGPVKAEKILEGNCTWEAVVSAYTAAGLTEQDALVQARVARILRNGDYDRAKARVKLWNPTKQVAQTTQQ